MIKNQPIHDQLLLYCLVKRKSSRGTVDKKEMKAILEKDCWPRRYIFPHQPGLQETHGALAIYTGRHVTRSFPGIADQSTSRNRPVRVFARDATHRDVDATWAVFVVTFGFACPSDTGHI